VKDVVKQKEENDAKTEFGVENLWARQTNTGATLVVHEKNGTLRKYYLFNAQNHSIKGV
jgi:hypothetical protein